MFRKEFVVGDIHGHIEKLEAILKKSGFSPETDHLICLGDVCDRGPDTAACIELLRTLPHVTFILGNHDLWALEWARSGKIMKEWRYQGGDTTVESYKGKMPESHIEFLKNAKMYWKKNKVLFVHAGIDPDLRLREQNELSFLWDRELVQHALYLQDCEQEKQIGKFTRIFVGHTPTINWGSSVPIKTCNIWMLDTGAGWGKKLSIMDVHTEEFWQS